MGELSILSVTVTSPLKIPSHSPEKYPLSFPSLEGSGLLRFYFLLSGDVIFLGKPSSSLREKGLKEKKKQLLGSRRGKETPRPSPQPEVGHLVS